MKKIFITGGGGYVGSALTDYIMVTLLQFTICLFMVKMFLNQKKI